MKVLLQAEKQARRAALHGAFSYQIVDVSVGVCSRPALSLRIQRLELYEMIRARRKRSIHHICLCEGLSTLTKWLRKVTDRLYFLQLCFSQCAVCCSQLQRDI